MRIRVTWLVGCFVIGLCAWWTLAPRHAPAGFDIADSIKPPVHEQELAASIESIDPRVFAVRLWNPPPPPPEPERHMAQEQPPPKPLRLQLIGIITEGRIHKAAVYDPDSDRLLIVATGDKIAEHTIIEVTPGMVQLSDGRTSRTLRLEENHS